MFLSSHYISKIKQDTRRSKLKYYCHSWTYALLLDSRVGSYLEQADGVFALDLDD